jgi:hypothetical protein
VHRGLSSVGLVFWTIGSCGRPLSTGSGARERCWDSNTPWLSGAYADDSKENSAPKGEWVALAHPSLSS